MMTKDISHKLVVAISSRALFDLDESNAVYEQEGVDSYADYQIQHENEILKPGVAFTLVEKFLKLNQKGAHLFLSTHAQDVRKALEAGHAAATIFSSATTHISPKEELRIAFDGDAVLFSDEAEQLYQQAGLAAFTVSEQKAANHPLSGGPFKGFLAALQQLQSRFPSDQCPIRTALVTARQAPAHERVIKTLRAWNIRIDEALFLGGLEKGRFLQAFEADIFFDDQHRHCQSAAQHVATGHVPNGILNENV
ncbi:5'-nucleotidase [Coxiella burnetii]|uniref:5'-nucleotidase n=1 Tax=Coxiella burnetii TaxID=777 RepID=UPI000594B034|nr:5'-nucleotidase [Coxiella burnetii]